MRSNDDSSAASFISSTSVIFSVCTATAKMIDYRSHMYSTIGLTLSNTGSQGAGQA